MRNQVNEEQAEMTYQKIYGNVSGDTSYLFQGRIQGILLGLTKYLNGIQSPATVLDQTNQSRKVDILAMYQSTIPL